MHAGGEIDPLEEVLLLGLASEMVLDCKDLVSFLPVDISCLSPLAKDHLKSIHLEAPLSGNDLSLTKPLFVKHGLEGSLFSINFIIELHVFHDFIFLNQNSFELQEQLPFSVPLPPISELSDLVSLRFGGFLKLS